MKKFNYPYNEKTGAHFCTACKNAITDIEPHYHRCPYCGMDFAPKHAQVRVVMRNGGRL